MMPHRTWYRLRWPRELTPEQTIGLCRLLASVGSSPVVLEAVGCDGQVEHRLALPAGRAAGVVEQLQAALPGLGLEKLTDRPEVAASRAAQLRLSSALRPLRTDDLLAVNRALLTAMAYADSGESLSLQWVLGRALPPSVVPNHLAPGTGESWWRAFLLAPLSAPQPADGELRTALRLKHGEPGWKAAGRLGVAAGTAVRERQLIAQLTAALRASEAPGVRWRLRPTSAKAVRRAALGWWPALRLGATDLAAVAAWPVGATGELPVTTNHSRMVPPPRAVPRRGRVLGEASFPGQERPLALTPHDALRHLHVLGPTGVGKSTLLMNVICQDLQAGRAAVVMEPKGDLIADVLARVPAHRVDDVVLIDPTDVARPVGLNPLAPAGRSPELVADQLLGLFHALYAANWGPRTHDILGASLLTLARTPGMTLTALPLLLMDAGVRRRIVPKVTDPIALGPFWATFEGWREHERLNAIAPVMNKLRPMLLRPDMRAILGQARPRFEIRQIFTQRKILLVNLAAGQVGPETSALLGSLLIGQLWQAILGRATLAPAQRHPVMVVLDEFQSYLHLPLDLADALAQARGLGVGFSLAHQFLHQLDPLMRSAVLANAQSRLAFRLGNEDARLLATGSSLAPEDWQGLGAFAAYAQLVAGDAVQPWCSLRSLPPAAATSEAAAVRAASRAAYGADRKTVEAEIEALVAAPRPSNRDDLTPRLRIRSQP
jgi:hypothetical protein